MNKIVVQQGDFDVATEYQELRAEARGEGAIVFFVGLVRDLYAQPEVAGSIEYIELQHYPGMTEQRCTKIVEQAQQKFPFSAARLIHRVGKIYADEQIVMVAVASAHRYNAFQAAQFIMDFLKTRATLWKKEVGSQGECWIGMKQSDNDAAAKWSEQD